MQYLNEDELSALIMAVHRVAQKGLPLLLVGAGLPQLVGLTGKSKSYAERLFDFPRIGPLSSADAKNALRKPVEKEGAEIGENALNEINDMTQGYPYFLQEWGITPGISPARLRFRWTTSKRPIRPFSSALTRASFACDSIG
jgi:hypothetical protein